MIKASTRFFSPTQELAACDSKLHYKREADVVFHRAQRDYQQEKKKKNTLSRLQGFWVPSHLLLTPKYKARVEGTKKMLQKTRIVKKDKKKISYKELGDIF